MTIQGDASTFNDGTSTPRHTYPSPTVPDCNVTFNVLTALPPPQPPPNRNTEETVLDNNITTYAEENILDYKVGPPCPPGSIFSAIGRPCSPANVMLDLLPNNLNLDAWAAQLQAPLPTLPSIQVALFTFSNAPGFANSLATGLRFGRSLEAIYHYNTTNPSSATVSQLSITQVSLTVVSTCA
jgi:hypothetical protein